MKKFGQSLVLLFLLGLLIDGFLHRPSTMASPTVAKTHNSISSLLDFIATLRELFCDDAPDGGDGAADGSSDQGEDGADADGGEDGADADGGQDGADSAPDGGSPDADSTCSDCPPGISLLIGILESVYSFLTGLFS